MERGDVGVNKLKRVVVLNGDVYHVGEWDYQKVKVEELEVIQNPLPEGATLEERQMEFVEGFGWLEVGYQVPLSETDLLKERLEATEQMLLQIMMEGMV